MEGENRTKCELAPVPGEICSRSGMACRSTKLVRPTAEGKQVVSKSGFLARLFFRPALPLNDRDPREAETSGHASLRSGFSAPLLRWAMTQWPGSRCARGCGHMSQRCQQDLVRPAGRGKSIQKIQVLPFSADLPASSTYPGRKET